MGGEREKRERRKENGRENERERKTSSVSVVDQRHTKHTPAYSTDSSNCEENSKSSSTYKPKTTALVGRMV